MENENRDEKTIVNISGGIIIEIDQLNGDIIINGNDDKGLFSKLIMIMKDEKENFSGLYVSDTKME